jgi:hypothetical protein
MTETLQRLQDCLSAVDRCYCCPRSLDFLPHASAEHPLLATTLWNAVLLTYQATLRSLKIDTGRLATSTRHWPLRWCLRVALLQANMATRLMILDHIVSAFSHSMSFFHYFRGLNMGIHSPASVVAELPASNTTPAQQG